MKSSEQLNAIISKLDEVTGRLIVAAATDTNVKKAMEITAEVSIKLGELSERIELSE